MSKVCAVCGKKPSFGPKRSHSMVATQPRVRPKLPRARGGLVEGAEREGGATLGRLIPRSALMGARGNSGGILSQILRGAADVLAAADEIDEDVLVRAFRGAAVGGYRAVREPVEGTMLSA